MIHWPRSVNDDGSVSESTFCWIRPSLVVANDVSAGRVSDAVIVHSSPWSRLHGREAVSVTLVFRDTVFLWIFTLLS